VGSRRISIALGLKDPQSDIPTTALVTLDNVPVSDVGDDLILIELTSTRRPLDVARRVAIRWSVVFIASLRDLLPSGRIVRVEVPDASWYPASFRNLGRGIF
jgi:hypothetical protein